MTSWAAQSAVSLTRSLRDGEVSSVDLLDYFIERYERLNPAINAVVATDLARARQQAAAADKLLAGGAASGPLHGLPMTLKDNLEFVGLPTTYGVPAHANHMPSRNADVVQAVLDAGAVVYGKTNLPLFGMDTQSFNDVYGQTNNPWDLARTPGGSSGGAAAALAAGINGLEIGNDIGGSIRFPAHLCGIYGHKPTFNIVSMHGGDKPWGQPTSFPVDTDLAVNGPLARSAEDLMLAMDILVGAPGYQRKAINITLPGPRQRSLSEFRVGLWLDDSQFPVDREVSAVLAAFVDRLDAAGVNLVDRKPAVDLERSHVLRNQFEAATGSLGKPESEAYAITHRNWLKLNMERSLIRQQWEDYFSDIDVMLCPVARIAAHTHDHTPIPERQVECNDVLQSYWPVVGPWNALALVSYLPATVVPAGLTSSGLPVGVQLIEPYLEDRTTIQFAMELEDKVIGPYQLPPGFEG